MVEGSSRYAFPLTPLVLVCPSARTGHVELFWCGAEARALQVRVAVERWPRRRLNRLVDYYARHRRQPAALRGVVDWGLEGNEICCRYFRRHPGRLTWLELDLSRGTGLLIAALHNAARSVAAEPGEAAEIRWGNEAELVPGA